MGAWGPGVYENDDALDWLGGLDQSAREDYIAEAFRSVLSDPDEYLEAPEATIALAAAEVVAAWAGLPGDSIPEEVANWIGGRTPPSPELVADARRAVKRVLSNSELRELWMESDHWDIWHSEVEGLGRRLASGSE